MDIISEEKPKPLSTYPGPHHHPLHQPHPHPHSHHPPPPPSMHHHRRPPIEAGSHHAPPGAHGLYEPSWRPYHPSFDPHPAAATAAATTAAAAAAAVDQRRASNNPPPQPPISAHGYPVMPGRELPQLPPDGPFGRPSSLPGPAATTSPPDVHPSQPPSQSQSQQQQQQQHSSSQPAPATNYRHMNGAPPDAPPPPHSATAPDYRARLPFPPDQPSNGEPPLPAHSVPPAQYPTPVPAAMPQTPAPFDPPGYYQSQAYGMRQRKAARAQQVK